MKHLNPIMDDRTFTAYQKRGYEFSILMAQKKDVRPWLLTKYCNCLYGKNERSKFDFVIEDGEWFAVDDVFIIDIIRIRKQLQLPFQNNLKNIIINRLKKGLYVYGYFDEYYIKNKSAFRNRHFKHSFLIFGYDDEDRKFYAIGYTNNLRFEKYTIEYDDFFIALTSFKQIELTFVYVNPNYSFKAKIENIRLGLYDYIHSIHSNGTDDAKLVYGLDTLFEFAKYVQDAVDINNYLDLRYSRFFMEFKTFMLERLTFLYEKGYIGDSYKEYSNVCQMFQIIHMLFIKYNITKEPTLPQRMCNLIDLSREREKKILSTVLSELNDALIRINNQNYI